MGSALFAKVPKWDARHKRVQPEMQVGEITPIYGRFQVTAFLD